MIIVRLKGGLGNQMFQYAFAKYLSIQKNEGFSLDVRYLKDDATIKQNFVSRDFDLEKFVAEKNIHKSTWSFPFQDYILQIIEKVIKYIPFRVVINKKHFFVENSHELDFQF